MCCTAAWSECRACSPNQILLCVSPNRAIAERIADAEECKPLLDPVVIQAGLIGLIRCSSAASRMEVSSGQGKDLPLSGVMVKMAMEINKISTSMGSMEQRGCAEHYLSARAEGGSPLSHCSNGGSWSC